MNSKISIMVAWLLSSWGLQAQTTPGTLTTYATIHSIGVEWNISGDGNHNATCLVEYRVSGNALWRDAQPLFRVDFEGYDMLAGSVLFLVPDTEYELRLTLSDVDGGNSTQTRLVRTQKIPTFPTLGQTYHVIPGNGGGSGTAGNPFQGVAAAQVVAQPGDTFLLHAGDYGTGGQVNFTASGAIDNHILWRDAGDGPVTFNQVRIEANYIWLHGLNFIYNAQNGQYGLRTSPPAPQNIVLTRNHFENCHYCIFLNDGGDDWYIADNTIIGDRDISAGSDFAGEGIELQHTSGHTVAYNRISDVADGISYPHRNVDIFGNDILDTTDDGIEGDYGHSNVRIWRNRISNVHNNGISFQPMDGAPWYVLYNQVAAPNEDALKLRSRSDRVLLAHNTLVAWNGPVSSGSDLLRNFKSRNNLWISIEDRYVWENGGDGSNNWKTDLDYDGFDWGNYPYAFKWGDIRLVDIPAFQAMTGQEMNAVDIDHLSCFNQFNIPNPPPAPMVLQHLTLDPACPAVNAGQHLANINEIHQGSAPDLGALEVGQGTPHYGPRPLLADLIYADDFE
ncbi:right-handed parallel beta-helix repeat-containing protein [Marinicella meishanensis]|uniref:right-handed parallel beta-helix repeat-containing protein n=1 Tax=Marinicella meishanensis TaxID=2873263 RepID=UPI001CBB0EF0|nr:right-handed parallel beta-helix repeat-containing protein [Marinicella sp. NBU2979]